MEDNWQSDDSKSAHYNTHTIHVTLVTSVSLYRWYWCHNTQQTGT